jgi:hypothetical protein
MNALESQLKNWLTKKFKVLKHEGVETPRLVITGVPFGCRGFISHVLRRMPQSFQEPPEILIDSLGALTLRPHMVRPRDTTTRA